MQGIVAWLTSDPTSCLSYSASFTRLPLQSDASFAFLLSILSRRGFFVKAPVLLQEFPTVLDGGQDPIPLETQLVEEEFDLSDIMQEELDAEVGTKEDRLRQLEEQVGCFPRGV